MTYEDQVIEKLLNELTSLRYDKPTLERYLLMAYAVGYDAGTRSRSNHKAVVQLSKRGEFIQEYQSARQAGRANKLDHSNINKCCRNVFHSSGGFMWQYKEDYEKNHTTSES